MIDQNSVLAKLAEKIEKEVTADACVVIEPASNGYIARDEIRQRRFAPKPTD